MKILTCIFVLILLIRGIDIVAAEEGSTVSDLNFSQSSPLRLKLLVMQNSHDHWELPEGNLNLLSKNIILSNQPKLRKDRRQAFFRSLLLPGAGEYYLGARTLAKTFFFTEITLWASYFAFREYGKWVRDDALAFAATHSGAKIQGKPSQFLIDIGNYQDIYQYNDAKQRYYQFDKVYTDESYYWSWDLESNRHKFDQIRIASDRAFNRSVFVLGSIFANHLLSAIHSVWQTHRYNKKLEKVSDVGINFHVESNYSSNKIILTIQKSF